MKYSYAASYSGDRADGRQQWVWDSSTGHSNGQETVDFPLDQWHHIAISFNKRAWKIYVNGQRIMNVPNVVTPPGWFHLSVGNGEGHSYFTNFRIAKGAKPLYDRLTTDGKIITYGITFDVGKSTIKPESMSEINRIATLMKENPDLKFSVEGHTDNTGSAATNQTLSDARSKAVLDKLVELGIDSSRLSSAGKGQNSPIADNSTDEGRAKNRRVEFVKM
ncbi:MAG: OmpA family protein [Bacteroidales bacterium]|nr:OmpA family protein [Bacteroidales bacterium]